MSGPTQARIHTPVQGQQRPYLAQRACGVRTPSVAHCGAHNSLRLAAHHRCCCALSPRALRLRPARHQSVPPAHLVWTISLIHNGGEYWVLTSAQGRTRGSHHGIRVTTPPRRPQVHPKVLTTTHNRYSPTEAPRRGGAALGDGGNYIDRPPAASRLAASKEGSSVLGRAVGMGVLSCGGRGGCGGATLVASRHPCELPRPRVPGRPISVSARRHSSR